MPGRNFNPRPPRGGGDKILRRRDRPQPHFNPRPPRGGATVRAQQLHVPVLISIHAPREGGATSQISGKPAMPSFQSTPPARGGDRAAHGVVVANVVFQSTPPARGGDQTTSEKRYPEEKFQSTPPARGGDSKDAQFYLRIFDKQVELLRFLGKIRGGCLRNPEKDRRFFGKSLANLPEISGHLDFAGGGKARPGYPCAVPLPRRAACVRGSGDPPADRCSSYRNAPLFSHIASLDSKSADCLSQNP